jgi:hypothetical protein
MLINQHFKDWSKDKLDLLENDERKILVEYGRTNYYNLKDYCSHKSLYYLLWKTNNPVFYSACVKLGFINEDY